MRSFAHVKSTLYRDNNIKQITEHVLCVHIDCHYDAAVHDLITLVLM